MERFRGVGPSGEADLEKQRWRYGLVEVPGLMMSRKGNSIPSHFELGLYDTNTPNISRYIIPTKNQYPHLLRWKLSRWSERDGARTILNEALCTNIITNKIT